MLTWSVNYSAKSKKSSPSFLYNLIKLAQAQMLPAKQSQITDYTTVLVSPFKCSLTVFLDVWTVGWNQLINIQPKALLAEEASNSPALEWCLWWNTMGRLENLQQCHILRLQLKKEYQTFK